MHDDLIYRFRWYRCAQPPANGFDPFGINTCCSQNSASSKAGGEAFTAPRLRLRVKRIWRELVGYASSVSKQLRQLIVSMTRGMRTPLLSIGRHLDGLEVRRTED